MILQPVNFKLYSTLFFLFLLPNFPPAFLVLDFKVFLFYVQTIAFHSFSMSFFQRICIWKSHLHLFQDQCKGCDIFRILKQGEPKIINGSQIKILCYYLFALLCLALGATYSWLVIISGRALGTIWGIGDKLWVKCSSFYPHFIF